MGTLVIYESMYGNTEQIARAIADGLGAAGSVEVRSMQAAGELPAGLELLVVGGPTYAHGVEASMKMFLDGLPSNVLDGVRAAAFDTRLNWPKLLSGAASKGIADRLERKGALIVADPESFLVEDKDGPLLAGELERAAAWGRSLAASTSHAV